MGIELWSRREGIVQPPASLLHAEPGSCDFPMTFRTRVFRWSFDVFRSLQRSTEMGDVINDIRYTLADLCHDLCSAYGREPLVPPRGATLPSDLQPPQQLRYHVQSCDDLAVLDYIDAVYQKAQRLREGFEQSTDELNRIFEEEGVGYRRVDGRLVRFDGEVTHREAVVPALAALATGRFGEAEQEFNEALADFGRGTYRDALTNANAAFESVLKVLTGRQGQAGDLIKTARQQELSRRTSDRASNTSRS